MLSFSDIIADFVLGFSLLSKPDTKKYGIVAFGIDWFPGFVTLLHIIATYRGEYAFIKLLSFGVMIFCLYPIVPIFSLLYLLYYQAGYSRCTEGREGVSLGRPGREVYMQVYMYKFVVWLF